MVVEASHSKDVNLPARFDLACSTHQRQGRTKIGGWDHYLHALSSARAEPLGGRLNVTSYGAGQKKRWMNYLNTIYMRFSYIMVLNFIPGSKHPTIKIVNKCNSRQQIPVVNIAPCLCSVPHSSDSCRWVKC